jgi:hypothetical protein
MRCRHTGRRPSLGRHARAPLRTKADICDGQTDRHVATPSPPTTTGAPLASCTHGITRSLRTHICDHAAPRPGAYTHTHRPTAEKDTTSLLLAARFLKTTGSTDGHPSSFIHASRRAVCHTRTTARGGSRFACFSTRSTYWSIRSDPVSSRPARYPIPPNAQPPGATGSRRSATRSRSTYTVCDRRHVRA